MANSSENKQKFQPEQHLEQRDGVKYLPLKWRLAWLRSDQPQAQVLTKLISHSGGLAVFQARIKLPEGAIATGWGAQARTDEQTDNGNNEPDLSYISQAENQALERALTVLGYGTEYSFDFDNPFENEGIALNVVSLPAFSNTEPPTVLTPLPLRESSTVAESPKEFSIKDELQDLPIDEAEESEDAEAAARQPTNIRSVSRPTTSARPPANVTPLPTATANRDNAPRPITRPAPAPVVNTNVSSQAVNERLQGIEDSGLRILIKQIYTEARRLHNLDEDKVDKSSMRSFGRPVYELMPEEAEEYLERIKNAVRKNQ